MDRRLFAYVQPIVELASGCVVGFEALARLYDNGRVLAPAQFMDNLDDDQRLTLFSQMMALAGRFVVSVRRQQPDLYVSVNVEASLLLREDFCARVAALLPPRLDGPPALYLELLESERIGDLSCATANLETLRNMGVGISLDDVGSAYSSLILLKRLPIDTIKLDQAFARELTASPEGLQFVHSVLTLARGLGCKLIVEGVETLPILDAVAILGATYGQGYAIAKPMPTENVSSWLSAYVPTARRRIPASLLGAYASHLNVVETCRILRTQPLPLSWGEAAHNPHACGIGIYFDRLGLHDTPAGLAHQRFHEVIDLSASESQRWNAAAEAFRLELKRAIWADNLKTSA